MGETAQRFIVTLTIALLSIGVMGGAIVGWLLGRTIPEWMAVLVGSIGTGAFISSGFFVLARNTEATMAALADSRANHHALAMAVAAKMTTGNGTDTTATTINGGKVT